MKIYCNVCNKYRKSKNPKISNILKKKKQQKKKAGLSIAYCKCGHECNKIFKAEELIEILKIFVLVRRGIRNYIIMSEEKISQEFRLKNMDETINYFNIEINQNELMRKKHKKVCRVLNYIDHLF